MESQRILNTMENTDHVLVQSLYKHQIDVKQDSNTTVAMNVVHNGYDAPSTSMSRTRYELLKKLATSQ